MALGKSWGPYTWYLFHILSLTWEKKNVNLYKTFFKLIKQTIPCHQCYLNFKRELSNYGNSIEKNCVEKKKMFEWLINLHNIINRRNNKKIYSYKEVFSQHIRKQKLNINNKLVLIFIREYIGYNLWLNPRRRKLSLKLLRILAYIYPSIKKRMKLIKFVRKNSKMNYFDWVQKYVNIIRR